MRKPHRVPHIMRLGADDLLHCRFALSPLWETHQAVRTLDRPAKSLPYHLPWLRRSAEAAPALDLLPLWLLMPEPGYTPDFVCPPPLGLDTTFEDEISAVRATDLEVARYEIHRALADGGALHTSTGQKLLADPARAVQDLAALLEQAWQALVAPHWPRLRTLLEADIAFHARRLAEGGLASLFADLHPEVSWSDGTLTVRRHRTHVRTLHGEGLLLMPSVFAWPEVISGFDPPWQPTLVYPARGIGGLWAVGGPQPSAAAAAAGSGPGVGACRARGTGLDLGAGSPAGPDAVVRISTPSRAARRQAAHFPAGEAQGAV
ncbi:hypothetical protein GCM10022207_71400 [Streptomyces lannensis]|uniref:DUF5937 domain-containing protein n=1 Tax=Streptomyces lannensis TaxID=766498 RepID=A0ABP7L1K0_9ACTN